MKLSSLTACGSSDLILLRTETMEVAERKFARLPTTFRRGSAILSASFVVNALPVISKKTDEGTALASEEVLPYR